MLAILMVTLVLATNGVTGYGYTHPMGDISKEINDTLKIICILNVTDPLANGLTSSDLYFTYQNTNVSEQFIHIVNSTAIEMIIPNLNETEENYTCKIKGTGNGVAMNKVYVGYKPGKVFNFKCRSQNWENMTCTFERPLNPVVPRYKLIYRVGTNAALVSSPMVNECELYGIYNRQYGCNLKLAGSTGYYRQNYEYYFFELQSSNILGNNTEYFTINHFESVIPNAPREFHSYNITSNSVSLKWSVPYAMKFFPREIIHKVVYTCEWCDSKWTQLGYIEALAKHRDTIEIRLTNLSYAFTWYDVRVQIKVSGAKDVDEMWSNITSLTFKTSSRIPDKPPKTDIGAFHINAQGHVCIFWEDLPDSKKNGFNLRYVITATKGALASTEPNKLSNTRAKYEELMKKVSKNSDIEFSIKSVNHEGESIASSIIRVPRASSRLPHPVNIKKFLHNQMYNLSWSAPPMAWDEITSYTVFWCESQSELENECDTSISIVNIPKNQTNYLKTISNKSNKTINFAISANSRNSSSGMVWASCTALPNNDIGKVKTMYTEKIQATFMEFKWGLQCIDLTILEGFNLTYCPINDPVEMDCKEPERSMIIGSDAMGYNITNLMPYTTYKTYISMLSANRTGPPSELSVKTTLEAAPTPPRNLRALHVTNTSITLSWNEPEHINGVLMSYKISYNGIPKDVKKLDSPITEYTLEGLSPFTRYDILLLACTVDCSQKSNEITVDTAIGVPGNIPSTTYNDDSSGQSRVLSWIKPRIPAGKVQYYEIKRRIEGSDSLERIVKVRQTHCTIRREEACLPKHSFYVRPVNVIQTLHATGTEDDDYFGKVVDKRNVGELIDLDHYENVFDNTESIIAKRHSNAEIESHSSNQLFTNQITVTPSTNPSNGSKIFVVEDNFNLCEEENDSKLERFLKSDKHAVHLHGNWSLIATFSCENRDQDNLLLEVLGFAVLLIAIGTVSLFSVKKFKKIADIHAILPPGLDSLKEDTQKTTKSLNLDYNINNNRPGDIVRVVDEQEEQSLLRNRMESGSSSCSNSTENNSHCEYNEGIDDSESEPQNDEEITAQTISENLDSNKSSPTPLLSINSKVLPIFQVHPQPDEPSAVQQQIPAKAPAAQDVIHYPISSNNYAPSLITYPQTSSGYVTHDAIATSNTTSPGYTSFNAAMARQSEPSTPDDAIKQKTPIVATTDIHGISGYVTHKQLSNFGQLIQ